MTKRFSKFARFLNRLLYIGSAVMLVAALFLSLSPSTVQATANPGAIWTTNSTCGVSNQDVNHFNVGDHVYINFSGFQPGTYPWSIQKISGNVKTVIASGNFVVGPSGSGCFDAHTIQQGEGGHEYSVNFGNKNDNYRCDDHATATPTKTMRPTKTSTALPTATNTAVFTATNTFVPTDTLVPTATDTLVPTATDTMVPTATDTLEPTVTDTQEPTATPTDEIKTDSSPTPTDISNEDSTPTPDGEVSPTPPTKKVSLKPLVLAIDPFCTVDGLVQWTVENPNNVNITMYSFSIDGGSAHSGFSVHPGEMNLTTTPLGTHTVSISYGEAQTGTLTYTLNVCPLPIPVTGNDTAIIPVTGANLTGNLGNGFFVSGLSLAGLGLILSSLRKIFHL
jgi:hypothetical protein